MGTIAWYSSNSSNQTHAVGGKAANALGFYDMSGNVWEWMNDAYGAYPSGAQTNPSGPASNTNSDHVLRGGSWDDSAYVVRSSFRGYQTPDYINYKIGFRIARNP